MPMFEGQDQEQQRGNGHQRQQFDDQRQQVEQLAQRLSQASRQQWQKAIEGMVALPAAIVVGAAASALYTVSFITRGFEVFQQQAIEANRQMSYAFEEQQQRTQGGNRRLSRTNEENREEVPRA